MKCLPLHRFRRPARLVPAVAALGVAGIAMTACGGSTNPQSLGGHGASPTIPQPRSPEPDPQVTPPRPTPPTTGPSDGSGGHVPSPNKGGKPSVDCSTVKCIALTFDDGPGPDTGRLLDTLKAERVPATFFVVGKQAQQYPDLVRREAAEGHEVGNHTWDHKDLSKLDDAGIRAEIDRSADAIAAAGAPRPTLLRPPYGAVNDRVRALAGAPLIMWRVDPEDWKYRDAGRVADAIVAGARPGRIVLSHDIQKTTVEAIPAVIGRLRAEGYTFVTVSTLLNGVGLENGKSYFNRPVGDSPAHTAPPTQNTQTQDTQTPSSQTQDMQTQDAPSAPDSTEPRGTGTGTGTAGDGGGRNRTGAGAGSGTGTGTGTGKNGHRSGGGQHAKNPGGDGAGDRVSMAGNSTSDRV